MLYQGSEGSSTPGKPVSPWRKVDVLAIYTKSNQEYRLFDPTAVVHSADWLDLNTFPPVEDALPRTKSLLNTWKKNAFTVTAIQCSGHVTGSHHEYTLSEPTAVAYSADWLLQNSSSPSQDCFDSVSMARPLTCLYGTTGFPGVDVPSGPW